MCCAIDEDYCSQHATKNTNFSHRYIKYSGRDFLHQQSWTRKLITLIYLEFSVIIPTCSQSACYHEFFTSVSGTCFRPGLRSLHQSIILTFDEHTNIGVQDVAWVILPTVNQVLDSLSQLQHQSPCLLHKTNVSSSCHHLTVSCGQLE